MHLFHWIFLYFCGLFLSVKWMRHLHSFTYYIKNYPGKIFLLKRKFVLLLLLCRIVITKKQQTVQRQLCWFTAFSREATQKAVRGKEASPSLRSVLMGLLESSMQVTTSATYLFRPFTHLSVFLKGLFKQLHPTLVSLFSLQFLWNMSFCTVKIEKFITDL